MKKTGLKGSVKFFSVDFNRIDTNDILYMQKYFMKKKIYKTMFGIIMKIFIGLFTGLVNGSNHAKCVSLSSQKCSIQPTLIDSHSNEYNQEFHNYPVAVKLDRCVGSCNALNDLPNKVRFPNKSEHLNIRVFNMITGKNESKVLTKDISWKCKFKLMEENVISNQKWNNDKS